MSGCASISFSRFQCSEWEVHELRWDKLESVRVRTLYSREWEDPVLNRNWCMSDCDASLQIHQLPMKLSDMIPLSRNWIKMRMNDADYPSSTVNMIQTWRTTYTCPLRQERRMMDQCNIC